MSQSLLYCGPDKRSTNCLSQGFYLKLVEFPVSVPVPTLE